MRNGARWLLAIGIFSLINSLVYLTYQEVAYGDGLYFAMPNKSQTYSVEADNAELRHYLACLARRSRCFSRSIYALRSAVLMFIYCWNERQLYKQFFPDYPCDLIDFLCPCF